MAKRRRKLRSLIAQKAAETETQSSIKLKIFLGCILSVAAYFSNISTSMIWSDFQSSYRNQYNLIVHGEQNYCKSTIDTEKLLFAIRRKVINQETALAAVDINLRNESKFVALGIVGASGIGKSLFAQLLKGNFPWQENTQLHTWSTYNVEDHKLHVQTFIENLSECGRNLIIIDNLGSQDVEFVRDYNKMLYDNVLELESVNLVVVYIFNIVTYTPEHRKSYNDKVQGLQQLENVKMIEFRKFDSDDVKDCIQHETKNLNLTLDDEGFKEVLKLIDADRSGCKNVYSKVLMFGKKSN